MTNIIKPSEKTIQDIKLIELIHIVSNIISGGFLGIICIGGYLLMSKDIEASVKEICYDIINFNLSFIIYFIIGFILLFVLIGFVILPILYCTWVVILILGAIKHFAGERYVYPMTITFIK